MIKASEGSTIEGAAPRNCGVVAVAAITGLGVDEVARGYNRLRGRRPNCKVSSTCLGETRGLLLLLGFETETIGGHHGSFKQFMRKNGVELWDKKALVRIGGHIFLLHQGLIYDNDPVRPWRKASFERCRVTDAFIVTEVSS